MHRVILQFPPPTAQALKRLRFVRSCSSQLSPTLFKELEENFKAPNPLPPEKRFPGCVGQATKRLELAILDEEGKPVPQGSEGEVSIRGANVTKGYLNNPDANKCSFTAEGFFRTGDQGKLSEDGYLTLTGRLGEMFNKGGEKISLVELDNLINQHEAVAEAVTFAMEDDAYGQDVGCAVKLVEGKTLEERDLQKWVEERLSTFKVPKKVWFPDEIPKTATGKVQRKLAGR